MSENKKIHNEINQGKKNVWLPLLLSLAMVGGMLVGLKLKNEPFIRRNKKVGSERNLTNTTSAESIGNGRIEEILKYINAKYVDSVSDKKIVGEAIENILQELDPHSVYIPADEVQDLEDDLEGEFDGIGLNYVVLEDTINIETPIAGGPSEKAGLLSGDKIVSINGENVTGKVANDKKVLTLLKGKKGTKVSIGFIRGDENKVRQINVDRDKVALSSIDAAYMLDKETGYIKINRFSANSYKEFMAALENLAEKQGMKDLVVDLRQNPGGYLERAVEMLSQMFEEKDKLLVYTKGRTVHRSDYFSKGQKFFPVRRIGIVIDEGTASAAEIVAGAIQDWDKGVVVGRRSFGKGLVQEPYKLKDGSELRLTVARYYTPYGRCIQKPYKEKTKLLYEDEAENRLNSGELMSKDSIKIADKTPYYTDAGRLVYSGGGITPDFFIPIETYQSDEYFSKIKPFFTTFAYKYCKAQRRELRFADAKIFDEKYKITEIVINDFVKFADQKGGFKHEKGQIAPIREAIRLHLKAEIGRQLFSETAKYQILNQADPCIAKTRALLLQKDPLGVLNKK